MPAIALPRLPDRPVRLLSAALYALLASISFLHQHYFLAGVWLWLVLGPLAHQQPPTVRRWLHALAGVALVAALAL